MPHVGGEERGQDSGHWSHEMLAVSVEYDLSTVRVLGTEFGFFRRTATADPFLKDLYLHFSFFVF